MKFAHLSVLSASMLIAACGGSGDSLSGGTQTPPAGTFVITSNNASNAVQASWTAAIASGSFGDLGDDLGLSTSTPGGFAKATAAPQASGFVVDLLQKVPFGPEVQPCLVSGTVTISGDIANPLTLTPDDTFSVVSESCDDGLGEVVDGQIDFTVVEFSGDLLTGTYLFAMDTVVTDLQVTTGTDTITSNGDATVSLDTIDAPYVESGVSGSSMVVDANAGSETLSNYASDHTVDGGLEELPYTMAASGTLDTTELSGTVTYSTPLTFAGDGADYPHTGELLVEGDNSSALLKAVDNVNVRIEVDVNADGIVDETINTTWAELTAP